MILFAADNHYGAHPGARINECLKGFDIAFHEDDWSCFTKYELENECDLMILNMIGDTCEVPHPDSKAEEAIKKYCEAGKNILLLHGSSAAFWEWAWWREIVGLRWVRPNDPEQIPASTHPKRPFKVSVSKTRHPLCSELKALDLPQDEIYINLEQMGPVTTLMETFTDEGTFPQAYESRTPWGGTILCFIPGHAQEVTQNNDVVHNISTMINYLLK